MQKVSVKAIVISETKYGESSKIINILTKEYGIIGVISKGCRKINSKLRSVSNRMCYGDYIINYKENGLSTLIEANILDSFKNIMTNINKISYSTFLLDLASNVSKQTNDEDIFDILITSLKKINENINPEIITLIAQLKYLKYLGIDINLECCSECGSTSNIVTLNVDKGGYICKACIENEPVLTEKSIKVIRLLYLVDIEKITKLDLSNTTIKEISNFIDEYYDKYSGLYLKSKKFLNIM